VLVLAYNFEENHEYILNLQKIGINVMIPKNTYRGEEEKDFVWHSGLVTPQNANKLIHNVRLFHLWQYFIETGDDAKYNRVIFTDGRDVIFQKNPSDWLDAFMIKDIVVPSEHTLYVNQEWNRENALKNYGPYIYEYVLKDRPACNVGTFACSAALCKDLCLVMYLMSNNIGHADQPSFNILSNTLLKDKCQWVDYHDAWALQIGTIVNELDVHTYMVDNEIYSRASNQPYCLVHQYDRIHHLKSYFDQNI
jgi:hypothetical protein